MAGIRVGRHLELRKKKRHKVNETADNRQQALNNASAIFVT